MRRRDPHEDPPRRRRPERPKPGPVATLDQLRSDTCWVWINCARHGCWHTAPIALAPLIIRWGPGTSSDKLRRSGKCTACGHKGATLTLPSIVNYREGYQPFPVSRF